MQILFEKKSKPIMSGASLWTLQNLARAHQQFSVDRRESSSSAAQMPTPLPDSLFETVGSFKNQYNRRSLMHFDYVAGGVPSVVTKRPFSATASDAVPRKIQTRSQTRAAELRSTPKTAQVLLPRPSKSLQVFQNGKIAIGTADTIGARATMEDEFIVKETVFSDGTSAHLWAVLDGHGGAEASMFVAAQWPAMLFNMLNMLPTRTRRTEQTQQKIQHIIQVSIDRCHDALHRDLMRRGVSLSVGTTLCAILYLPGTGRSDAQFYTINVGDSRALALDKDCVLHKTLTDDHKPSRADEYDRIWRLGGFVTNSDGVPRVQGNLAVSRSLGDFHLHPYVSHEATIGGPFDVQSIGSFLICCDGVTDVLSDVQIANAANASREFGGEKAEKQVAEHVRNTAYDEGSSDNISVLFVNL